MLSLTGMPPPPFEGFYSGGIRNPAKVMAQSSASRVAWDDNDIRARASKGAYYILSSFSKLIVMNGMLQGLAACDN